MNSSELKVTQHIQYRKKHMKNIYESLHKSKSQLFSFNFMCMFDDLVNLHIHMLSIHIYGGLQFVLELASMFS